MKRVFGLAVSAGLVFAATAANAQMLAPYRAVSDFDGPYERPYGAMPPAPPPPVYNYGAYGPPAGLMPLPEVYAVLRDNGFSPLGAPHQRGFVYTIAVMDRTGEDGRLVIDGRNGRIIRFVPAFGGQPFGQPYGHSWGPGEGYGRGGYDDSYNAVPVPGYGRDGAVPQPAAIRGAPRPPASVPNVVSRAVPLPTPKPALAGKPPEAAPQRSAAVEPKQEARPVTPPAPAASAPPAPTTQTAQTSPSAPTHAAPPAAEAKPAPVIQPTQPMPAAQGLE